VAPDTPLIECVPNFSEGRDEAVIQRIRGAIESVEGVSLLGVDPGRATNRTVYTFVGPPEPVCEAAFRAARVAFELIDMSRHRGEHPRMGALDVCPLVPISGISMEETVQYAQRLAQRIGEELEVPVYLYEYAATSDERRNLANIRAGEYEGLPAKLQDPRWRPDFGPARFVPRFGACVVGARDFLVAYNVNLNTTSVRRANAIAFDVRERGRVKRVGDPLTGEIVRDAEGNPVYEPGSLRFVKAIGWFIEEYGIAQISMNLTNLRETPIHVAFDEVCQKAEARGVRVTGSELVGLVPLSCMLEAGRYYLHKQRRSSGVSDEMLVNIAIRSLGLDDLSEFKREERIIEYAIADPRERRLQTMSVRHFVEETASESPAPGGGSVAATVGALGAALGTMVANLSAHKRGWDDRWQEFSDWAEKGKASHDRLLALIEQDTQAFDRLMAAFALPKTDAEQRRDRDAAIQSATRGAIEVPLAVMREALASMEVIAAMAEIGNPNSASDAGVGALCAAAAVRGAGLNVRINARGLDDEALAADLVAQAERIESQAKQKEQAILDIVLGKMS
jgi:glutamate formiminotransferase/formiminotetrahydrofolate cyclodeaminase